MKFKVLNNVIDIQTKVLIHQVYVTLFDCDYASSCIFTLCLVYPLKSDSTHHFFRKDIEQRNIQ